MNTTAEPLSAQHIGELIGQLSHRDAAMRLAARSELVKHADERVTRGLVAELIDPQPQVRWEAAKSLAQIADPASAYGLMHALDDEDNDVRWVAAEGLISLGTIGLVTVLSGLTRRARSFGFCRGAHHVLHELRRGENAATVNGVLAALESSEPEVTAPPAAFEALLALKQSPNCDNR